VARGTGAGDRPPSGAAADDPVIEPRPIIERLGLAAIAVVIAGLFAIVAVASLVSGELFLAAMGALGAGMTLWVGLRTLIRG
jgi:hypothetical protein